MTKFYVYATETVCYRLEVEAESEEKARSKVFNGEVDFNYNDIYDGFNFEVNEVEKLENDE